MNPEEANQHQMNENPNNKTGKNPGSPKRPWKKPQLTVIKIDQFTDKEREAIKALRKKKDSER